MEENRIENNKEEEILSLQEQTARLLENNGEFLYLSEEIWQAGQRGELPLEDMLLELPLAQWMNMVTVLNSAGELQRWEYVRSHLETIRTREDIRYDYLDMHMTNFYVSGVLQGKSSESVESLLAQYAQANMRYARKVYTSIAFEGGMDILPANIRGAFWVEKALSCKPQEHEKKMEYLGCAAHAWPTLGKTIKDYATLLGQEETKRMQEAEEATKELASMAVEVKKQILNFMDSGMYAEAYSVAKQLGTLMPDDPDLDALLAEIQMHFS